MDDRTELTEAEREALAWAFSDYACTHRGTEDDDAITGCSECQLIAERGVFPAVARILAARVSALSRDLAAQNTRIAAVERLVAEWREVRCGVISPGLRRAVDDLDREWFQQTVARRGAALSVSDPGQDKENNR